jgi:methylenetetrahydrofolate dehydrogenase (NADP+)/methenyltetrahydrofolate cyclohydrolase
MKLLKGKKIADGILAKIKADILKKKNKPSLAVVLVGDDKASQIYVALKEKAAKKVGIGFELYKFSKNSPEEKIIRKIKELNADNKINGIIVQLPLPKKFNTQKIINAIDPRRDVDGFLEKSKFEPVFPKAIMQFLKTDFKKKAVVVSNSKKFGEIMLMALKNKKISGEYFLANNVQKNLKKVQNAGIVISAVGKPGLIKEDMVKKGVLIIDGGITKKGNKVLGDVDFESVKNKASYLTPVPGGVGPVTIACLLENVYLSAKKSR